MKTPKKGKHEHVKIIKPEISSSQQSDTTQVARRSRTDRRENYSWNVPLNANDIVYEPYPGTVDPTCSFYMTMANETLVQVADKLGIENYHDLMNHPKNKEW